MEKKLIRDEALSLEGDGIIPKIYHLLTYKDPVFGTMPSIFLPHTIMFSFNIPEVWYFGNEKGVRRKLKINVTLENIEKAFLKDVTKNGIVAQYIRIGTDQDPSPLTFTYITKDELRAFLHSNKPNGILQKFVNPKGLHNYVLKVNWSPNFCLFEKVENLKKLDDDTIDLYHRAMTLEGRDYQVRTIPLRGSVLPHKLEKLAYHVSHHIKNATMENIVIARMTLVFKIDQEGKLWFLFGTSLRVQPYEDRVQDYPQPLENPIKPQNFNVPLSSPPSINAYKSAFLKTRSLKKVFRCQNCEKDLDSQQFFNIPLYQVINEYENDRQVHYPAEKHVQKKQVKKYGVANRFQVRPEEIDVSDSTIPKIVMKIYPDIKEEEYEVIRREPGFLFEEVKVCEDCYLKFSNNFEYVQDPKAIAKIYENFSPKGTGSLRPDIIDRRRIATQTYGKAKTNQLNAMLRASKQRSCIPDIWSTDASELEERPGKAFNQTLIETYKIRKSQRAGLHTSASSNANKELSQPKITEENLSDKSIDTEHLFDSAKIQLNWAAKQNLRKLTTSPPVKRNLTISKSPEKTEPVFLKTFYTSKNSGVSEKLLSPVAPRIVKRRIDSQNHSKETSLIRQQHAVTMTSFRHTGKISALLDDLEWQTNQTKSKERILKVYGSKAYNGLAEIFKHGSTMKDRKLLTKLSHEDYGV